MFPPAKPLKGLLWLVIKTGREHLADLRLSTKKCNLLSGLLFALYLCLKAVRLPTRPGRTGGFRFKTQHLAWERVGWECVYWGVGEAFPSTAADINSHTVSPAREAGYLQGETLKKEAGSPVGISRWKEQLKISVRLSGSSWGYGKWSSLLDSSMWVVPAKTQSRCLPARDLLQSNDVPPREL